MKKILFLCDGENFSEASFEFIRQLSVNETVSVKGLFFTPIDIEQMVLSATFRLQSLMQG